MTQTCRMTPLRWLASALLWLALLAPGARADATWIEPGADGQPVVHLYFFWSLTCPHCLEARPFVEAIPASRPWVKLHSLELTRHPEHVRHYVALADQLGQSAQYVPALLFCGRMQTGWDERRQHRAGTARRAGRLPRRRAHRQRARRRPHPARARPEPACPRQTGSRHAVAAGADRADRRPRRLQSVRVFRPAVPAVADGSPEQPRAHADHRRRVRAVFGPDVFRLHGGVAQPVPAARQSGLGDARRRRDGAGGRPRQRQGFLPLRARHFAVDSGIPQARDLPARTRHPRRRQRAGHARRHAVARGGCQFLRTAVHRRLSHGLHAPADPAGPRRHAALPVSGAVQRWST